MISKWYRYFLISYRCCNNIDSIPIDVNSMSIRYRYDNRIDVVKFYLKILFWHQFDYRIDIESTSNRYCYNIDTILENSDIISISFRYWFDIETISKWCRNDVVKINLKMSIRCCLKTWSFCKEGQVAKRVIAAM